MGVCVHFVCGIVGEYTHACGVVGVTLCLWGNGCVCFACGVVGWVNTHMLVGLWV